MKEARLQEEAGEGRVRCLVCERRCTIAPGRRGFCGAYENRGGRLVHTGWGLLSAVESRPIEIKPLFHYWPNSTALTFSGWGCNFLCPWCQNYHLSWTRQPKGSPVDPEVLVRAAVRAGDEGLCASFNEPATLYDYLIDLALPARREGLYLSIVTNAYYTTKALDALMEAGYDGWSVDIKNCPKARESRRNVLPGIDPIVVYRNARRILDSGGHVEMVYLVVTGYNEECADWIIERHLDILGPDVPLHVNRYYPANKWREPPTGLKTLYAIALKARREGLNYVYVGNVWDPEWEATKCPKCGKILIARSNYRVTHWNLDQSNGKYRCPRCGHPIPIKGKYIPGKQALFQ